MDLMDCWSYRSEWNVHTEHFDQWKRGETISENVVQTPVLSKFGVDLNGFCPVEIAEESSVYHVSLIVCLSTDDSC